MPGTMKAPLPVARRLVVGYDGAKYLDGIYFEGRTLFKATSLVLPCGFIASPGKTHRRGSVVLAKLYLRPGQSAPPDFDPLQDLVEEVSRVDGADPGAV